MNYYIMIIIWYLHSDGVAGMVGVQMGLGMRLCISYYVPCNFYRYYGLQLWFPEYFKRLREETCELQTTSIDAPTCINVTDLHYYRDTLYTAIASLPGNIAGALLINIIGGKVQLGTYYFIHYPLVFTSS